MMEKSASSDAKYSNGNNGQECQSLLLIKCICCLYTYSVQSNFVAPPHYKLRKEFKNKVKYL